MRIPLLYLCFALLFFSCSKSDDSSAPNNNNTTQQLTKKELLTAKPWKYIAWDITPPIDDGNGNLVSDAHNFKPECGRDDIIIFYANGNVDFDEGPTKCDSAAPQTTQSFWAFVNNETQFNMSGTIYTIINLTDEELKITFEDVNGSTTHLHTIIFNH